MRRRRWFWFGLPSFAVSNGRNSSRRLLRACRIGLSPWLWRRGQLRRWSRVTGLGYIGCDCIGRSDHGWLIAVASQSVMHRCSRNAIRPDGNVACDVVRTHCHVASGPASGD
jgi:hypothetical protein